MLIFFMVVVRRRESVTEETERPNPSERQHESFNCIETLVNL